MSALDALAVLIFVIAWLGYAPFVRSLARRKKATSGAMITLRQRWIGSMLDRDVRVADASLIGHVMSSVSFFASITVVVIAGLLGLIGNFERAAQSAETDLSWFSSRPPIEIKIVLVLIVMVYAFQAFAWAIRQLAYSLVLIGAAPPKPVEPSVRQQYSEDVAAVITQGAEGYDNGIRAYHFALAAVSWIVGPAVLIVSTCIVVLLLWRRQTGSRTARALQDMSGKLTSGSPSP
jgi:uncharacterized membrane protein